MSTLMDKLNDAMAYAQEKASPYMPVRPLQAERLGRALRRAARTARLQHRHARGTGAAGLLCMRQHQVHA